MMYLVEIGSADADIGAAMSHMQTWLDRNDCEPAMFRQVTGYGYRVSARSGITSKPPVA